jgi:pSer/pThr/pTyr-binding forkhead associated (FHA) protein
MRTLVSTAGPGAGARAAVADGLVIGRAEADLVVDDDEASRRHARVRLVADQVVLEDLGSTNGTWVNGVRIDRPTPIDAGDVVRIGETTLALEIVGHVVEDDPGAPKPAPSAPFAPLASERRRRIASRDLRMEVATVAVVVADAAALVVYFALR